MLLPCTQGRDILPAPALSGQLTPLSVRPHWLDRRVKVAVVSQQLGGQPCQIARAGAPDHDLIVLVVRVERGNVRRFLAPLEPDVDILLGRIHINGHSHAPFSIVCQSDGKIKRPMGKV